MKKNIIIIIVLLIISISMIYIYMNHNNNKQIEDNNINIKEANKYLDMVPFVYPSTLSYLTDAYSSESVTIEDIDESIILSKAVDNLSEDQLLSYDETMPIPDNIKEKSLDILSGYIYIKESDLREIIKNSYNYDLKKEDEFIGYIPNNSDEYKLRLKNIIFKYKKGYYISEATYTKSMNKKYSKVIYFKEKGNIITIKEVFGISNCDDNNCYLFNSENIENNKAIYTDKTEKKFKKYFLNNQKKFNIYIHTFKKSNNNYHWYSTEKK